MEQPAQNGTRTEDRGTWSIRRGNHRLSYMLDLIDQLNNLTKVTQLIRSRSSI